MLITAATAAADPQDDSVLRWRADSRYAIAWKGNVFLPGLTAGEATIDHLLSSLASRSLEQIYPALVGVFGLFVYDKSTARWTVLGDHSGLYRIFYTTDTVATSFLELARQLDATHGIDARAIVEFIVTGSNLGNHTPMRRIKKLRRDQVLVVDRRQTPPVRVEAKAPVPHETLGEDYVPTYFDNLARAIADRRVSVDLTGGFDTRLIACMLSRRDLPFDCGLAGVRDSTETRTASRVAQTLGRQLYFHEHDITRLDDDLSATFLCGDGLTEIPRLHRDRQLCLSRLARGTDIMVHGGGGSFFKDHYVIQDFPRYGIAKSNIERYYRLRIAPVSLLPGQLTPAATLLQQEVEHAILQQYRARLQATNNLTYDVLAYEFKTPEFYGATVTNYINMGMDVETPYIDYRMVQVAMRMSPWRRFFAGWHRRMTTAACPALAELPTAEGYTASARPARVALELGTFARVFASRVARKLSERYVGRALFYKVGELDADASGFREALRRSAMFRAAVARLQEQDILTGDLSLDKIRNSHVGRIMTMGTLLRYLDGVDLARPVAPPDAHPATVRQIAV